MKAVCCVLEVKVGSCFGEQASSHQLNSLLHNFMKLRKIQKQFNPNVYNGAERPATDTENFFTEEKVSAVMRDLKDKSSYGPDNIPVKVLRDAHKILAKPYHRLLNKIYHQNEIPEQ